MRLMIKNFLLSRLHICAAAFLIVLGASTSCHAIKASAVDEDREMPAVRELFRTFNISQKTSNYTVDVVYPQLQNPVADAAIRDFVDEWLGTIKNEFEENAAGERGIPFNLLIRFDYSRYSPEIISFVFYVYYYAGGAHDLPSMWSFAFDRTAGREILPDNIFTDTPAALAVISPMATDQVRDALGEYKDTIEAGGLAPFSENYAVFSIEENGITFYFPPYQAAPYAAGLQSAYIPFESGIRPLLAPEFKPAE